MQSVWFDIPTRDLERAVSSYSTILAEQIQVSELMGQKLGFFPIEPDAGVGGDLVPPGAMNAPSKTGTRVHLNCEGKLDDVLSRVEPLGGKIVQPRFSIGEWGFIAIIEDS